MYSLKYVRFGVLKFSYNDRCPFFCLGGRCSKDAPRLQKEQKFQFYALLGKDSKMPKVKLSETLSIVKRRQSKEA